ncbi:MAG: DNA polymerase III subunit chi [Gammaproteobacteria bacterium]|jgi:DNA polymerase-3 subunit chi
MTRIDFYILKDTAGDGPSLFTCRLAEKAIRQGHRIFINAGSARQLQQLDDLLWTFRAGSFLPHAICEGADTPPVPVLLGHATEPADCNDVLVNLSEDVPPYFCRFNRVAEPVGGDEPQRSAARQRYRFYQDRGYTLKTHNL